ncbi:DUF5711 family protein [Faecalimonas sp.]
MEGVKSKKKFVKWFGIIMCIVLFAGIVGYIFLTHRKYDKVHILHTTMLEHEKGENYVEFSGDILKYGKERVSLLNKKGKARWKFSYQMQNPVVSVNEETAVIIDKGANDLVILQKQGVIGEIHTTLPMRKAEVSNQGIVSVILKGESSEKIVCYDAKGNLLVEKNVSPTTTGYPLDIAISDDGYTLLVSYLFTRQGKVETKIVHYNFAEKKDKHLVLEEKYENVVAPSVFFVDDKTAAVVMDNQLHIYEEKEKPQKKATVKIKDRIERIFYDHEYIGLLLKGEKNYFVKLFDKNGKELLSETVEHGYKNIKVEKGQILMFDGKKCEIITKAGVRLFDGEVENDISNIISTFGVNKYLMINANGLEEIRLAK